MTRRCGRSWSSPGAERPAESAVRGRAVRRVAAGIGAVVLSFAAAAAADSSASWPPFGDGPGGVTCQHYVAAARLAWDRPGGDWSDAEGRRSGGRPYASAEARARGQAVSWDVASLVRRWTDGSAPPGALLLKAEPARPAGQATFLSREGAAGGATAPTLVLRWDDGRTDRLEALADTYMACPTHKSLGAATTFRVGDGQSALLRFAFQPRPDHRIAEATLRAEIVRQHRGGARIGVYAPSPPAGPTTSPPAGGLSHAHERDRGLEHHPDVLLVERFDRAETLRRVAADRNTTDSLSLVDRPDDSGFAPLDGPALRVRILRGTRQALNHHIRFETLRGGEPEEAYFRYHLRLGSDWDPVVEGGKLPGFSGTYGRAGWGMRRSDGTNGWSARGAFFEQRPGSGDDRLRGIGSYVYTATTEDPSGAIWGWNLGPTGLVPKGRWTAIEQYVRMNRVGSDDGVLRVWVDGRLAFERTDIRWRTVPELRIESVWLNVYHGGVAKADRDLTLYIDNLVIARQRIGPGRFDR